MKALLLAAGKGTRLLPYTANTPKPLLPLHGKPILDYIIDGLISAGADEFYVVVGYLREQMEEFLADQDRAKGYPFHAILQADVNGTGGAVLLARDIMYKPFLMTYGDVLISYAAYARLVNIAQATPDATHSLLTNPVGDPSQGAAVYYGGDGVTVEKIIEKPPQGTSTTNWNNAGCYVFAPAIFPDIEQTPLSPRGEIEITASLQKVLDRGEKIAGCCLEPGEFWCDVGYPNIYEQLNASHNWLKSLQNW